MICSYLCSLPSSSIENLADITCNTSEFFKFHRKLEEEISKELELQIKGAEKPSVWELLCIRFLLLPYTVGKVSEVPCVLFPLPPPHPQEKNVGKL